MPPLPKPDLDAILHATRGLWGEAAGKRFFITGGTGFFGTWLTESFLHINEALDLDAHLTILTRSPDAFRAKVPHLANSQALTLLEGDVRTFDFPSGTYDFVLHAATDASAKQLAEQPQLMFSTIVTGTQRVLEVAARAGTRKLLLTSSGAVYGPQPPLLSHVPEDFSQAPNTLLRGSAYGEGKRAAELLCALAAGPELEVKIARCWAFVGPHLPLDAHFAAGNFLNDALHGRPINVASDGSAIRSYLYAADLAAWLWTILFRGESLRAYNVGSEDAVSIRQLAEATAAVVNPASIVHVRQPVHALHRPQRYVPDTRRAREELGLVQSVSLEQALARTAAWLRLK